jgi:CRISPR-associated protein Csy1
METAEKPPTNLRSIFRPGDQFDRRANSAIQLLASLLTKAGDYTNFRIREARDGYINELISVSESYAPGAL